MFDVLMFILFVCFVLGLAIPTVVREWWKLVDQYRKRQERQKSALVPTTYRP